jgi:hypothetical protein
MLMMERNNADSASRIHRWLPAQFSPIKEDPTDA